MSRLWFFITISLLSWHISVAAQNPKHILNIDSYLNSAWLSKSVELRTQNLREYGLHEIINPIEGIQVKLAKTQTEDDEKQIAFRIKPRGLTEYKILGTLQRQTTRLEKIAYDQQISSSLLERYLTYIELTSSIEKRKTLTQLLVLSKRELAMVSATTRSSVTGTKELLNANEELQLVQEKIAEVDSRIALVLLKIKMLDSRFNVEPTQIQNFTSASLPTVNELENMLAKTDSLREQYTSTTPLSVQIQRERAEQAKNSISYDRARAEKLFDYFEMKVSQDKRERVYGFEIGFNIPGFSSSSYDDREKSRRLVEYDLDAMSAEKEHQIALHVTTLSLKKSIALWKSLNSSDDSVLQQRIRKLARRQDPMLAVSLEKDEFSKRIRRQEVAEETLKHYVTLLASTDLLTHHTRINFLSPQLREIQSPEQHP